MLAALHACVQKLWSLTSKFSPRMSPRLCSRLSLRLSGYLHDYLEHCTKSVDPRKQSSTLSRKYLTRQQQSSEKKSLGEPILSLKFADLVTLIIFIHFQRALHAVVNISRFAYEIRCGTSESFAMEYFEMLERFRTAARQSHFCILRVLLFPKWKSPFKSNLVIERAM